MCTCPERDVWGAGETPFEKKKKNEKGSKRRLRARVYWRGESVCGSFMGLYVRKACRFNDERANVSGLASASFAERKFIFPVTATTYPDAFTFSRPSIQFLIVCRMAATKPRRLSLLRLNRLRFPLHSAKIPSNTLPNIARYYENYVTSYHNFCLLPLCFLSLDVGIAEIIIVSILFFIVEKVKSHAYFLRQFEKKRKKEEDDVVSESDLEYSKEFNVKIVP